MTTVELKTHYEIVVSFEKFKPFFPDHVLEEMASNLAAELYGEVREVAD